MTEHLFRPLPTWAVLLGVIAGLLSTVTLMGLFEYGEDRFLFWLTLAGTAFPLGEFMRRVETD